MTFWQTVGTDVQAAAIYILARAGRMHCCVALGFTSLLLSWGLMPIQPKSITVAKTKGSDTNVVGVAFSVETN